MRTRSSASDATKALAICFALLCVQNTNAQSPVLTAGNTSLQLGDKFVFQYCNTNTFDTSGAGTNQTWNYSYLTDSFFLSQLVVDTQTCIDPSTTVYTDSFPNASIAVAHSYPSGANPHNDYWSGNSSYFYWGYYLGADYLIFKKPSARLPLYPVSYGSNYTDSSEYVDSSVFNPVPNNVPYTYLGADTTYADGYGTLILPGQTLSNVLRIKSIQSFSTVAGIYVYTRRIEAYYFFTPGYHANVFALQRFVNTFSTGGVINPFLTQESYAIYRATNVSTLPLRIVSFTASLRGQNALLEWQTASETNTSHFNVQRSGDGLHYSTMSTVTAAGNSSSIHNYAYTDEALTKLGLSKAYYRLQEVDKDGKSIYSNIQTINVAERSSLFSVAPNPAKDFITLTSSANTANAQVKVVNMSGKVLYKTAQDFAAGQSLKISLSQFSRQVLIVSIVSKETNEQIKIIKE